jgi:hypothetical protein
MDQHLARGVWAFHGHQTPRDGKAERNTSRRSITQLWMARSIARLDLAPSRIGIAICAQIPNVELWLPEGKREARAEDISDSPNRLFLMRQVIIGSGFAGPLFGVDQKKLNDEQLDAVTKEYRLVHFIMEPGKG